eukprot:6506222-Pyramimonas_sp.AAC.1
MENIQWASSNHLERTFIAIGDFNIREGVPLSYDHPLPDQAQLRTLRTYQPAEAFWRTLFDTMQEIRSE